MNKINYNNNILNSILFYSTDICFCVLTRLTNKNTNQCNKERILFIFLLLKLCIPVNLFRLDLC